MSNSHGPVQQRPLGALARLATSRASLTNAEQRIAAFILAEPEKLLNNSIANVANQVGLSTGTLVRFAKSVGYAGFPELRMAVAADVFGAADTVSTIHAQLTTEDSVEIAARKVFATDIRAVEDTLAALDVDTLVRARDAIISASSLLIFAVGGSSPLALDAYFYFLRANTPVHYQLDAHVQLTHAAHATKTTTALAISYSGTSIETLQCLTLAREHGATTILLTTQREGPMTKVADLVLLAVPGEHRRQPESLASRVAQMALLDALYVAVASARAPVALKSIRRTGEALSRRHTY